MSAKDDDRTMFDFAFRSSVGEERVVFGNVPVEMASGLDAASCGGSSRGSASLPDPPEEMWPGSASDEDLDEDDEDSVESRVIAFRDLGAIDLFPSDGQTSGGHNELRPPR